MKITYIGHSCFKVEGKEGSVVFDPYKNDSVPGLGNVCEKANLVLCSHNHGDHGAKELVEVDGNHSIEVKKIESYHDEVQGAKRGPNTIHVVNIDGFNVCHIGDLGCEIDPIENIDVLLVPVGGFFTIDGNQAYELTMKINPKIVIPMHYRSENGGFDVISTVDTFANHFDTITKLDSCTLEVEPTNGLQVIQLTPQNKI